MGPGIFKPEPYVKTGGMKLGPDFDWTDSQAAISSGIGGAWLKKHAYLDTFSEPRSSYSPSSLLNSFLTILFPASDSDLIPNHLILKILM